MLAISFLLAIPLHWARGRICNAPGKEATPDTTKAESLFERALKAQPQSIEAMLGKASLLMARHNFDEAHDLAVKAVETNPDSCRRDPEAL